MPKLGLSMTEGTIIKWLKKEGDVLKKGDEVLEIQTEKLTNMVVAPADGVLLKILAREGEVRPIAAALAYIGQPGEKIPDTGEDNSTPREAAYTPKEQNVEKDSAGTGAGNIKVKISPAAKALAEKLNINYQVVTGTGPNGRIIKEDIIQYGEARNSATSIATKAEETPQIMEPGRTISAETIPYAGMRKAIGTNMSSSWNLAPKVTHHVQVDVTPLLELRQALNSNLKEGQVKLTVTDMLTRIVAKALTKHPIVNSTLDGDSIKLIKDVNLGIAVALDNGLVVPVIRNADKKDVFAISREIKELSEKAKNNLLQMNDMQGGTFTISNVGGYGSVDFFTPIINQPESAILGVCRTQKAPVVMNDEIVIRSVMGLSLSFDHRVIDGAPAAEFLATVISLLENPARSIFE